MTNILDRTSYQLAYEARVFHPRLMLAQIILAPLPRFIGNAIRPKVLRMIGFNIGARTHMFDVPMIFGPEDIYRKLTIGRECLIGIQNYFDLGASITIGDRTAMGQQCMFITGAHATGSAHQRCGKLVSMPITIGNGVWIGARCTILPGTTIGDGVVIGACSMVSGDVPDNTYISGIPAVVKKKLPVGRGKA